MEQKIETITYRDSDGTIFDVRLKSGWGWWKNCYGDSYTEVTNCTLSVDHFGVATASVVKHVKDQSNPIFARTLALKRVFAKTNIPKHIRAKIWNLVGLKLSTLR